METQKRLGLACAIALLSCSSAGAQPWQNTSVVSDYLPATATTDASGATSTPSLPVGLKPSQQLPAARLQAREQLKALQAHNDALRSGRYADGGNGYLQFRKAYQNGFERALTQSIRVTAGTGMRAEKASDASVTAQADNSGLADGMLAAHQIVVDEAQQLRLKLSHVDLAPGTELWVSNEAGEMTGPFGAELADLQGNLFTPSVFGKSISLIVTGEGADAGATLTIESVVELFRLDAQRQPQFSATPQAAPPGCQEDAQCYDSSDFSAIEDARSAIGTIFFQSGGSGYVCTGGLINDTDPDTFEPLFLTANHCLSTSAEAASAEVFFDNFRDSCNGNAPSYNSLPRANGSTLLTSGSDGDYTLLMLDSIPGGRWLLGWNIEESVIEPGSTLHRLSSPGGDPQVYSQTAVNGNASFECTGLPRENFIYSTQLIGGTDGGSSGSPVLLESGQVVGQLYGSCGPNPTDACDYDNLEVDGKLLSFFPQAAFWLDPATVSDEADLAVTNVSVLSGEFLPGGSISIENTVQNIGGSRSDSYTALFYLSDNRRVNNSDQLIGSSQRNRLRSGSRHERITELTLPENLAPGEYYVGVVIDVADERSDNNVSVDRNGLQISKSTISITPALNGAWFEPQTSGQGILIEVFPDQGKLFMAWFTFDDPAPEADVTANLGAPEQRWLTGIGDFDGQEVTLDLANSRNGQFDRNVPLVTTDSGYGTADLVFESCDEATLSYDIPALGRSGTINLQRIVPDSVDSCEAIRTTFEGQ